MPTHPPDPVIQRYKRDVDRSLLRENLRLTPTERLVKAQEHLDFVEAMQAAGERARAAGRLK